MFQLKKKKRFSLVLLRSWIINHYKSILKIVIMIINLLSYKFITKLEIFIDFAKISFLIHSREETQRFISHWEQGVNVSLNYYYVILGTVVFFTELINLERHLITLTPIIRKEFSHIYLDIVSFRKSTQCSCTEKGK